MGGRESRGSWREGGRLLASLDDVRFLFCFFVLSVVDDVELRVELGGGLAS